MMICTNWALGSVRVVQACKLLHLASHIRLPSTRWDSMDTEHSTAQQSTDCTTYLSRVCPEYSPPIQTHLAGVVAMTFCQFTPSKCFKPTVLNPDSLKAETVGGVYNTSLISTAIFIQKRSSQQTGQMPFDTQYLIKINHVSQMLQLSHDVRHL